MSSISLKRSDPSTSVVPRRTWRIPRAGVVLASIVLVLLLTASLAPQLFTSGDPLAIDPAAALEAPSFQHPFGTDQSGRDVYTRIVYGARESMTVAVLATLISLVIGLAIGVAAGSGGRVSDILMSRLIEVMFSFPSLLLALMVITIFGASVPVTTVAIGISLSPIIARLIRAEVLKVNTSGYVEAARVLGHSPLRVISTTVAPNALRPLIAFAFLNVGGALIWATTLGYLGFGAKPPTPEWGAMLAESQSFMMFAWWLPLSTGVVVVVTAVSATVVGGYVQQVLAGKGAQK